MANETALDAIIQSYQDKVKANPDSLHFVQLADAYRKKGSLDEALEVVQTGLARHPNLLSGLLMMGRIYGARRQYAEAVEALKRVVQREPNNMTAHALLSQSFMSLNRWTEAIGEYQKILSLNPEDAAAQQALREALEHLRRDKVSPKPEPSAAPAASAAMPAAPARSPAVAAAPPVAIPPPASARPVAAPPAATAPAAPARSAAPMEVPAFAAAEELAARGLYDESIEALQRILEADPDNFMARQKLREIYAQREAMESPSSAPAPPPPAPGQPAAGPVETQADKITDDEILYLLGLMEDASTSPAAATPAAARVEATPGVSASAETPAPVAAKPVPTAKAGPSTGAGGGGAPGMSTPAPAPAPAGPVVQPKAPPAPEPLPVAAEVAAAAAATPAAGGLNKESEARVREIMERLASTEGMRQAFFLAGPSVVMTGEPLAAGASSKIVTLVGMLADVTRRAASSMKQGEVKHVLMFGTEGLVMVSPAHAGILAAVAGGSVKVGLLRIALNDCLKRLADVS